MSIAVDIIKASEGLRLKSYRDGAGHWTIGWGHTKGVVYGQLITEEQAEDFLREDMAWVLDLIEATVKAQLNENQHAATASLIFNIGPGQWRASTALRRLNAGNYAGAAEAMTLFNKSREDGVLKFNQGLANRRERERVLFLARAPDSAPVPATRGNVYGGKAKPMIRSRTQWWAGLGLTGVLANILTAYSSIKVAVPEVILTVGPLVLLGGVFVAIMVNRLIDSRKGVH